MLILSLSSESQNSYFKKIATDSEATSSITIEIGPDAIADQHSSSQKGNSDLGGGSSKSIKELQCELKSQNIKKMICEVESNEHNYSSGNKKEELMWKKNQL